MRLFLPSSSPLRPLSTLTLLFLLLSLLITPSTSFVQRDQSNPTSASSQDINPLLWKTWSIDRTFLPNALPQPDIKNIKKKKETVTLMADRVALFSSGEKGVWGLSRYNKGRQSDILFSRLLKLDDSDQELNSLLYPHEAPFKTSLSEHSTFSQRACLTIEVPLELKPASSSSPILPPPRSTTIKQLLNATKTKYFSPTPTQTPFQTPTEEYYEVVQRYKTPTLKVQIYQIPLGRGFFYPGQAIRLCGGTLEYGGVVIEVPGNTGYFGFVKDFLAGVGLKKEEDLSVAKWGSLEERLKDRKERVVGRVTSMNLSGMNLNLDVKEQDLKEGKGGGKVEPSWVAGRRSVWHF